MTTKAERLRALKKTLDDLLPEPLESDARILLWQFIQVFKAKKRYDKTNKWYKKAWYAAVFGPMAVVGYVRDVRVNSTAGKLLFGEFAKFGTLTATLKRVIKHGLGEPATYYNGLPITYIDQDRADRYNLAIQICEVLNDWDEGHC